MLNITQWAIPIGTLKTVADGDLNCGAWLESFLRRKKFVCGLQIILVIL